MKFQTAFAKNGTLLESNTGPRKVATAGYIPAKTRIENLILAGQRLQQARAEMYDNGGEIDDDDLEIDPTRSPGYDMADASQTLNALDQKARTGLPEQSEPIPQPVPMPNGGTPPPENAPLGA